MITIGVKKIGARVIATVKVGQGSEAANEAEARHELRKTLEEVLEALGPS